MRLRVLLLSFTMLIAAVDICSGSETICLKTGFCLEAESHSATADAFVLHVASGTLEISPGEVASIQVLSTESSGNAAPVQAAVQPTANAYDLLSKAAYQQGLGSYADFVRSVAKVESGLQQTSVSPKGAAGLMQLMPATAADMGVDPRDAFENALGGAKYLRFLLIRYHGDSALALAAYNAGPAAVDRFHGIPPYRETRNYVVRVLHEYEREHRSQPTSRTVAESSITRQSSSAVQ